MSFFRTSLIPESKLYELETPIKKHYGVLESKILFFNSNDEFVNSTVTTRFIEENPQLFDFQPSQNRYMLKSSWKMEKKIKMKVKRVAS